MTAVMTYPRSCGGDMSSPQKCPSTRNYLQAASDNRSVLEQSLRYGPLEARRTAFSVALAIFGRMRGEVQRPVTTNMTAVRGVAPPTSKRLEPRFLWRQHAGRPGNG
jgi:hypothetical protein